MQLRSRGAVIHVTAVSRGQSHTEAPGKFDFYCSKGHRLAYYLFNFYVKFRVF